METSKYIYGDDSDADFFDTEFGNAIIGAICGLGIIGCLIGIFTCVLKSIGG